MPINEPGVFQFFYRLGRRALIYIAGVRQIGLTDTRRFADAREEDKLPALQTVRPKFYVHHGLNRTTECPDIPK
jgi:hypothetical protein